MKSNWIPTNKYYQEMMAAPDAEARLAYYRNYFLKPWRQMHMMFGANEADELAGARGWHWLLPEQQTAVSSLLQTLESANAWQIGKSALEKGVAQFQPYAEKIGIESVEGWLILADPDQSDPINRGYTGGIDFTHPRLAVQFDMPNEYSIPRLAGAIVHEFNHLVRMRLFPWDMTQTTVGDYIIHEGLAESFAAELFGEDIIGYYVTEFDEAELETAQQLIHAGLDKKGFNLIRSYIFGDYLAEKFGLEQVGMPSFGGYAIGYRVVQAYLKQAGCTATEATLLPAQEIIEKSGFFE